LNYWCAFVPEVVNNLKNYFTTSGSRTNGIRRDSICGIGSIYLAAEYYE